MSKSIAILGKASVGKTFFAAHLGMAMGYLGDKTLVVGCDQKRDTTRALSAATKPSLMEGLEMAGFDPGGLDPASVIVTAADNVDVMELGPSQLIVGHYGTVLEDTFATFARHETFQQYDRIIYDVNDEHFDSTYAPLYRHVEAAIAVSDDTQESLFVVNRLLRAVLIGASEFGITMRLAGLVHNRSANATAFEQYVERSKFFPLITIAESHELAQLRPHHRTVFAMKAPPPHLASMVTDILKIAEMMRGHPFNLYPVVPLEDEEIWSLAPPPPAPN